MGHYMPLRVTLLTSLPSCLTTPLLYRTTSSSCWQHASERRLLIGADLHVTAITLRQFLTGKSVYRDPRFTAKHCQSGSSQFHIKLFSSYLHNISHHAPHQIEIRRLHRHFHGHLECWRVSQREVITFPQQDGAEGVDQHGSPSQRSPLHFW